MKCKICGKESETEYCTNCMSITMKRIEYKAKESSKWNKILAFYSFIAIVFCSTLLITSGASIPFLNSESPEEIVLEEIVEPESSEDPVPEPPVTPEPTFVEDCITGEDILIDGVTECNEVYKEFCSKHTYTKDEYDSEEPSEDLWRVLNKKGYKAQLILGNVEFNKVDKTYTFESINAAWVIVYLDNCKVIIIPEHGITLSPEYFTGFYFDNPEQMKKCVLIHIDYIQKRDRFNMLQEEVDEIFQNEEIYKGTGIYDEYGEEILELIGTEDEEIQECFEKYNEAGMEYKEANEKVNEAFKNVKPYR